MLGFRLCVWAVALIFIATACQVNSKVPPKFIRATRGASKAIYGTRSGYPPIFSGPRKLVVGSTSLKREIGSPPANFPSPHGRRVRRRKTVKRAKKPSRRPSSYAYGLPVYAQRYKYYAPSRPVRYKTRAKPVAKLKLRMPTYTQLQDPDDYEEEDKPYNPDESYDYFDEPKPQVMSVTPIKTRPRPVITVVHHRKKKKKRPKYSSKPKSTTPRTEEDDEDTKDEDDEDDEGYHRKPSSKPHRYHTEEPPHRYQTHKYTDSDGSYTQTPNPSKFIPPYILASNNNYGGGAEHNHAYQNHGYYTQMPPQYTPPKYTPPSFTPPVYYPSSTFNPHQYRATGPADTDIGFGQGMEYVADQNPSPWK
ncbi:hypothetical protein LSTR_LSTR013664 [Laodelphax striatellus]|uniref:Uncharacterized protein n=1 Tax=Laodelphax striatellus TaxID=195883 RepID=A0A482WRJ5_LAOST|nr:hypothetical protein LSTR_LSTR013664 [Laodelphax striatellus]